MTFKSKIIKIDSSKATTYYNAYKTNFMFLVDPAIFVSNDEVIVYSLLNAWIPYSFYSVNQYNQYLDVAIVETISSVIQNTYNQTIIIPSGNYSTYDFVKTVSSLINLAFTGVAGMTGNQFSISYNKINNTFTISFTSSLAVSSSVNYYASFMFKTGPNASHSCYKLMGCPQQDIMINSGQSLATNLVLMNDIAYFQIRTDLGDANTFITGDETGNLLDIIPVSSEPLSYISYAPFQPNKFILHNHSLTEIKIGLVDNYGRDVNLNGIPFLITLKIDLVTPEEAGIPKPVGRDDADEFQGEQGLTNLQIISNNPSIIARPAEQDPLSVADLIEYNLIQHELAKVKKQMQKKNKKSK